MSVNLRSPEEIELMAASGAVLAAVLDELSKNCRPGVKTSELDELARDLIGQAGGTPTFLGYRGFDGAICASVNDLVVHGIPGPQVLESGDLISIDVGVTLDGWITDAAITVGVGATATAEKKLMDGCRDALQAAIAQCTVTNTVGDIGAAVSKLAQKSGLGVFPSLCGHGVGRELHEEPRVPNVGQPGQGTQLAAGMVLAIEPMLTLGIPRIRVADDGWSVFAIDGAKTAHMETTVAICEGGPRVLAPWGEQFRDLE